MVSFTDEYLNSSRYKKGLFLFNILIFLSYIKTDFEITGVESSLRVTRCKQIIQGLPEHNYVVLKYLMCFLHMVSIGKISKVAPVFSFLLCSS